MNEKKPFVLRWPPEVLWAPEQWAQDEFRSVNGQIESILNDALTRAGRKKKSVSEGENQ